MLLGPFQTQKPIQEAALLLLFGKGLQGSMGTQFENEPNRKAKDNLTPLPLCPWA